MLVLFCLHRYSIVQDPSVVFLPEIIHVHPRAEMRRFGFGAVLTALLGLVPATYAKCYSNATSYDFV